MGKKTCRCKQELILESKGSRLPAGSGSMQITNQILSFDGRNAGSDDFSRQRESTEVCRGLLSFLGAQLGYWSAAAAPVCRGLGSVLQDSSAEHGFKVGSWSRAQLNPHLHSSTGSFRIFGPLQSQSGFGWRRPLGSCSPTLV